jgi:DNA-binding transcriptional LysR family regulator
VPSIIERHFLHAKKIINLILLSNFRIACLTAGFIPKTLGVGPELLTIANLVSNDIGVTLMPTDMINLLPSHQIKGIDIKNQNLHSSMAVVWNNSSYVPAITLYALEKIKQISLHSGATLRISS